MNGIVEASGQLILTRRTGLYNPMVPLECLSARLNFSRPPLMDGVDPDSGQETRSGFQVQEGRRNMRHLPYPCRRPAGKLAISVRVGKRTVADAVRLWVRKLVSLPRPALASWLKAFLRIKRAGAWWVCVEQ